MAVSEPTPSTQSAGSSTRRAFLSKATLLAMWGGLIASYGTFAAFAGRFLYPAKPRATQWLYVAQLAALKSGESMTYTAPDGSTVAIARRDNQGKAEDFIALSSTCPHLGCQVHWEGQKNRFFCPCHNGTFNPEGKATGGPPGEAGQSLPKYPLLVKKGLLYIEVPVEHLKTVKGGITKPGHDAVLLAKCSLNKKVG